MNYTNSSLVYTGKACQELTLYFKTFGIDIVFLRMAFVITALLIVSTNGVLITKLVKKKHKTRPDKLFMILTVTDLCTGLISIPIVSLPLHKIDLDDLCKFSYILTFFSFFPCLFSVHMCIIIALDRYLIITRNKLYKKYVRNIILYCIIFTMFLISFLLTMLHSITGHFFEFHHKLETHVLVFVLVIVITELLIFPMIFLLYYKLYKYVLCQRENIVKNRSGATANQKLIKTITFICLSVLVFIVPHFALFVICFLITTENGSTYRIMIYSSALLIYSNAWINAVILLWRFEKPGIGIINVKAGTKKSIGRIK